MPAMKPLTLRAAPVLCLFRLLVNEAPAKEPGRQATWEKFAAHRSPFVLPHCSQV